MGAVSDVRAFVLCRRPKDLHGLHGCTCCAVGLIPAVSDAWARATDGEEYHPAVGSMCRWFAELGGTLFGIRPVFPRASIYWVSRRPDAQTGRVPRSDISVGPELGGSATKECNMCSLGGRRIVFCNCSAYLTLCCRHNNPISLPPARKHTVVIAADQGNARSILMYQRNLDKVVPLSSHSALGVSGPNADLVNFSEYIQKNIALYELSNDGMKLSTHAQANFMRGELAAALRRGPYQVNVLLGGYDAGTESSSLYFLDYLASLQKVNYGCQGYASSFCLSIMDRDWKEGLTEDEAIAIVEHCMKELQTRFLIAQPNFIIKVIDKDGVKTAKFGADPADT